MYYAAASITLTAASALGDQTDAESEQGGSVEVRTGGQPRLEVHRQAAGNDTVTPPIRVSDGG